jgi:glycosyltransferase involved in cell wall biosynthesis
VSRVLLVCPEPLGHGQPAGIGIRFIEIARVLRGDGHAVTVLSPDAGAVDGCPADFVNPGSLLAASETSDVAVVQGHVANAYFQHAAPIPTVVDLYDPYIIENLHYYAERGAEVFDHDHFTLMTSIARGDYFLCASEAQRLFYAGLMLASGRLNPMLFEEDPRLESIIGIAPFGVGAARPERASSLPHARILFGGIYDWYDPIAAIDAVALVRETLPDATLTFTMHPNPELTPQGKLADAMRYAREKTYDCIRFEPWAPYERRAEFFEQFTLALLTFPRSLETDLAMRTRVYDYLWSGLPIVTSSAPGTDEILARYEAGSVLAVDAPRAFADEIVGILRDPARHARMVRGAGEFVLEHQWDRTLAPLRAFCRAPRVEKTKGAFGAAPEKRPPSRPSIVERWKRRLRA